MLPSQYLANLLWVKATSISSIYIRLYEDSICHGGEYYSTGARGQLSFTVAGFSSNLEDLELGSLKVVSWQTAKSRFEGLRVDLALEMLPGKETSDLLPLFFEKH